MSLKPHIYEKKTFYWQWIEEREQNYRNSWHYNKLSKCVLPPILYNSTDCFRTPNATLFKTFYVWNSSTLANNSLYVVFCKPYILNDPIERKNGLIGWSWRTFNSFMPTNSLIRKSIISIRSVFDYRINYIFTTYDIHSTIQRLANEHFRPIMNEFKSTHSVYEELK